MTVNDIEDIAEILDGYQEWRTRQLNVTERDISVSAYVDELSRLRAIEAVGEIKRILEEEYEPGRRLRMIEGVVGHE